MKKSVILDILNWKCDSGELVQQQNFCNDYLEKARKAAAQLKETLDKQQVDLLREFEEALGKSTVDEVDFYFAQGFRLGLLLGIECME